MPRKTRGRTTTNYLECQRTQMRLQSQKHIRNLLESTILTDMRKMTKMKEKSTRRSSRRSMRRKPSSLTNRNVSSTIWGWTQMTQAEEAAETHSVAWEECISIWVVEWAVPRWALTRMKSSRCSWVHRWIEVQVAAELASNSL